MPHEPLVSVRGLVKRYAQRGGRHAVDALAGVDLDIAPGATVALVGESGSGKSTLARCLARLEKPDAGEIRFGGADSRPFPEQVQLVLQDAAGSLNPAMRAVDIVAEPLLVRGRPDARRRALELMEQVGLPANRAGALPHEFSGGQRQRLAIARALALEPRLLILDEALSGLDLSIQAQIANLLLELQQRRGIAYLFITHDPAMASRVADATVAMRNGRIVGGAPVNRPPPATAPDESPRRAAGRWLGRRLAHAALVLFGVSLLSFGFLEMAPGDYLSEMRMDPRIAPETVEALRARHGLDKSLPVKYWRWVESAARGDFGHSFAYNAPVAPLVRERARNTLALTVTAMLLSWAIAIPLGLWFAARRGGWADRAGAAGISALLAIPDLLLALGLLMLAVRVGSLPAGGMPLSGAGGVAELAVHMVLPVSALVLGALPMLVRHVRAAAAETLRAPFIQAARAHGIHPARLMWRHVLPAAANPLISLFGFSVGTLLSASLLVEVVMSWPGLGPLLVEAIQARDLFVVIGGVLFSAVFLVGGNLLADVLLYVADPRIRKT
jgi:peptide/nickel transport system permease protein